MTKQQYADAMRVTRHIRTATKMLCTEKQWASALALLKRTGIHHAVIDVANKKGGYQKIVPDTNEEMNIHEHRGNVTVLASTRLGRELCV